MSYWWLQASGFFAQGSSIITNINRFFFSADLEVAWPVWVFDLFLLLFFLSSFFPFFFVGLISRRKKRLWKCITIGKRTCLKSFPDGAVSFLPPAWPRIYHFIFFLVPPSYRLKLRSFFFNHHQNLFTHFVANRVTKEGTELKTRCCCLVVPATSVATSVTMLVGFEPIYLIYLCMHRNWLGWVLINRGLLIFGETLL